MKVKVRNLKSPKTGREVPNQFIIGLGAECVMFQSYNVVVAKKEKNQIILDENYWDYSRTTLKYLKIFLNDWCLLNINSKKDIEKLIKENKIKLDNLN